MRPLTVTTRDAATGPVLEISGDLDHATAPEVRETLTNLTLKQRPAAGPGPGPAGLLRLQRHHRPDRGPQHRHDQGADFALAAVPPNTARVLNIIGLDRVFTVYPDSITATASWVTAGAVGGMEGP